MGAYIKIGITLLIVFVAIVSGCSKDTGSTSRGNEAAPATSDSVLDKPVKLTMYMHNGFSEDWTNKNILDLLKKRYPQLTVDVIYKTKDGSINDLISAGTIPDMFFISTTQFGDYWDAHVLQDLTELMKKHRFDLDKYNSDVMDAIRLWDEQAHVYALPHSMNFSALYYNKDIFDKFGVSYPPDGMLWEDAVKLSNKITRTADGTAYVGLDFQPPGVAGQLVLPLVDPKTNKAMLELDGYKKIAQLAKDLYKSPEYDKRKGPKEAFLTDRNLAMYPFYSDVPLWADDLLRQGVDFHWDMATMPTFKERPNIAFQVDSFDLLISRNSKNQDAAFEAIAYLLSPEPQTEITRNGQLSALNDPAINKNYGANLKSVQGKHVEAIFKVKPAPNFKVTKYDNLVKPQLNKAIKSAENGTVDINTALREANEAANKSIESDVK
jgi:multiple sugar transport system substrate-binding protein